MTAKKSTKRIRDRMLAVWMTADERDRVRRLADRQGLTVSDHVRQQVLVPQCHVCDVKRDLHGNHWHNEMRHATYPMSGSV